LRTGLRGKKQRERGDAEGVRDFHEYLSFDANAVYRRRTIVVG
jgi:hypothetical protein